MKNDPLWPAPREEVASPPPPGGAAPLLDAKVMMVDDEPLMTALIETHLEDGGYTKFVATSDPLQALDMLRREKPGVLLLDLMMPGLSGFDLLSAIRADDELRYLPVIVLTAATGASAKLRALQLGATDFLAKPVDASELVLRVRNTLAFHHYTQRLINLDLVTQLPNERMFDRGLAHLLANQQVTDAQVALFSVEMPDCKSMRETLGVEAADEIARVVSRRLLLLAETEDPVSRRRTPAELAPRVARLAVDRFALLLEAVPDSEAVQAVAKRLVSTLAAPLTLGMHELVPTVWAGISITPGDGCDAPSLRRGADLAATHAKQQGFSPVQFASVEINMRSMERLTLGSQLRHAAERGELLLHYQPKVNLADGRISGAEALLRWQHPQHGLVPPARFIPLAEELGLITCIGQWVAEQACRDAASWSAGADASSPRLSIAINVSKLQFRAGNLCAVLRQALFDAGLPPQRLVIELTESMLMDDVPAAIALMEELKRMGVSLSIDDFGTGYSSLSYLKRFKLDELKIDRSFVIDLPDKPVDVAIARTIVELGHSLGMRVVAEGVETPAQRDCMRSLGCDGYQGFLYSRPLPNDEFRRLIQASA